MDPETTKLLRDTFLLAEDNNKMLHKIRNGQKWASVMRVMYWLIIIGISIGAFYFMQPYIAPLEKLLGNASSVFEQLNSAKSQSYDIQNMQR
ncbi:MAG: hypothetical protein WCI41_01215 [bacterium]